ncbi:DNA-binding transcriptional regulator, AcrR family [Parafrankia irregularis]|uniref:DNA-binding transcriptional regulator, AcrR family n=1 Tax=Parafrankia irregularis TaxID=795642 RepID=A0A0S4QLL8_9ACTN|nr:MULTISPECIES: TetR/AcrR family transcriptional regulator [Parafrankia]MBE3205654.1 TetR/AcrR family transcriptional regulator [Parafrankia sp. CH37]CUU55446.1 DNA-binding transcriptional regulator, AcrR family [Parafrankia irregularis]
MAAALELFVRQGYASTTLEDVAAATPVSRQTIYNHFGDKETLFLAVIDEHITATLETLREATAHFPSELPDPEVYLNELARRIMATFLDPRSASLRVLVQTEGPRNPPLMQLWRQRVAAPVWSELIGQLARLAHGGALRIDDPARAAGHFIALVSGTVWEMTELGTFAVYHPPGLDDPALEAALRSAVGLFVRGYAPGDRPSD